MDIFNLKPVERIVEIENPDGSAELLGIRVTLMSIEDERLKKLKRKIQDARLHLEARNKSFSAQEIEDNRHALVFGAMVDWEWYGDVDFHGEKRPVFNQKNVMQVLTELPWFLNQIERAVSDESSFFQT